MSEPKRPEKPDDTPAQPRRRSPRQPRPEAIHLKASPELLSALRAEQGRINAALGVSVTLSQAATAVLQRWAGGGSE